ncbi:TetR/AcrR family transcriptional regulator [Cucumibacter marinus]|uniref:TetR/AcrR family transcriptional regulator n=1 Tax=Cucumibacter marinus TaxID=1121252 RepID=UPI00048FAE54|nr:TetR/AcrR family transcriptional regulator [Cucumibacter marinus]
MADSKRQPKFRRRAEARPDEVLDAALDLFIEKGFAATRVADIAARAGLSKGAVYLYFESKEAVLEALVRRALAPIAEQMSLLSHAEDAHPRAAIEMLLRLIAGRAMDPKVAAVPKIIMAEVGNFPALAKLYRRQVLDMAMPVVTGLIERGVKMGVFRPVDPEFTLRSVIGPVIAHVLLHQIFGIGEGLDAHLDRFIDNHIDVLMNGLAASGGSANG